MGGVMMNSKTTKQARTYEPRGDLFSSETLKDEHPCGFRLRRNFLNSRTKKKLLNVDEIHLLISLSRYLQS